MQVSDSDLGSFEDRRGNDVCRQDDSESSNASYDGKLIRCTEKKSRDRRSGYASTIYLYIVKAGFDNFLAFELSCIPILCKWTCERVGSSFH